MRAISSVATTLRLGAAPDFAKTDARATHIFNDRRVLPFLATSPVSRSSKSSASFTVSCRLPLGARPRKLHGGHGQRVTRTRDGGPRASFAELLQVHIDEGALADELTRPEFGFKAKEGEPTPISPRTAKSLWSGLLEALRAFSVTVVVRLGRPATSWSTRISSNGVSSWLRFILAKGLSSQQSRCIESSPSRSTASTALASSACRSGCGASSTSSWCRRPRASASSRMASTSQRSTSTCATSARRRRNGGQRSVWDSRSFSMSGLKTRPRSKSSGLKDVPHQGVHVGVRLAVPRRSPGDARWALHGRVLP